MRENVVISHRGAGYEIGRAENFYGIWPVGSAQPQPLEWWPVTPDGWAGAWARFTAIETPGTIVPVTQVIPAAVSQVTPVIPGSRRGLPFSAGRTGAVAAVALLALGVLAGLAGLFPGYLGGSSLVQQPAQLVPHLIYLAAWTASAVLIVAGGARLRAGALLGTGLSAVTFGLFFADAGTAIAGGSGAAGAGLVLGLIGWLACAAGSVLALRLQPAAASGIPPAGAPGRPLGDDMGPVVMLMLAALGTAAAFAPSWDSFVLRVATGATQTLTEGNAFANPAPVIAGDVAVMVALVVVVAAAALWRPVRLGAALLAGAIIPMAAQAISAFIQVGEPASPAQFGFSPAQAAQAGLTISPGLTAAFWIYCAFLVALIASFAWMLMPPHTPVPGRGLPPYAPSGDAAAPDNPAGVTGTEGRRDDPHAAGQPPSPGAAVTGGQHAPPPGSAVVS